LNIFCCLCWISCCPHCTNDSTILTPLFFLAEYLLLPMLQILDELMHSTTRRTILYSFLVGLNGWLFWLILLLMLVWSVILKQTLKYSVGSLP
jgi:hypothetical protein